jgi:hypothetical protein
MIHKKWENFDCFSPGSDVEYYLTPGISFCFNFSGEYQVRSDIYPELTRWVISIWTWVKMLNLVCYLILFICCNFYWWYLWPSFAANLLREYYRRCLFQSKFCDPAGGSLPGLSQLEERQFRRLPNQLFQHLMVERGCKFSLHYPDKKLKAILLQLYE